MAYWSKLKLQFMLLLCRGNLKPHSIRYAYWKILFVDDVCSLIKESGGKILIANELKQQRYFYFIFGRNCNSLLECILCLHRRPVTPVALKTGGGHSLKYKVAYSGDARISVRGDIQQRISQQKLLKNVFKNLYKICTKI